jgi:microcin C transport system permease protein
MIPTLFGILLITFVDHAVRAGRAGRADGGAVAGPRRGRARAGDHGGYRGRQGVDAKRIEEIKKLYGFDKPPHERFSRCSASFARFDLGRSFFHNKDVSQLIMEKLPVSISLGLWTFLLVYLISLPLGIAKAVRAGTHFDTATTFVVLLGYAIPSFVLGVVLLVFLRRRLVRAVVSAARDLRPQLAASSALAKITDYFWHIALPVTAMVLGGFA